MSAQLVQVCTRAPADNYSRVLAWLDCKRPDWLYSPFRKKREREILKTIGTNDVPCRARKAQWRRRVGGRRGSSARPLDLMIGFFCLCLCFVCVCVCPVCVCSSPFLRPLCPAPLPSRGGLSVWFSRVTERLQVPSFPIGFPLWLACACAKEPIDRKFIDSNWEMPH